MKSIALLATLCLLFACTPSEPEGVTPPTPEPPALTFTEELRLNADSGGEEYTWVGAKVVVQVNNQGHMFVMDEAGKRILEFATDGSFVRQIGQEGQGPEEFVALRGFTILADQTAIVHENRSGVSVFTYYDADMNFVDRKTYTPGDLGKILISATFSPDGKNIQSFYMDLAGGLIAKTGILSSDGFQERLVLSELPLQQLDASRITDPAYLSEFIGQYFKLSPTGMGLTAFAPDGGIYSAVTTEYRIRHQDPAGNEVKTITHDYTPKARSDEELTALIEPLRQEVISSFGPQASQLITENIIKRAVDYAEFKPVKQPLYDLITLPSGEVLAISDYSAITGAVAGDLFNAQGDHQINTALPKAAVNFFGSYFGKPVKLWFVGPKAYTIESNAGDLSLVRYGYSLE